MGFDIEQTPTISNETEFYHVNKATLCTCDVDPKGNDTLVELQWGTTITYGNTITGETINTVREVSILIPIL